MTENSTSSNLLKEIYLSDTPLFSKELSAKVGVNYQHIPAHLRFLVASTMIRKKRVGKRVYYFIPEYSKNSVKKYLIYLKKLRADLI